MAADIQREFALARQRLEELRSEATSWSGSGAEFSAWKDKVLALIRRVYGPKSQQEEDFGVKTRYSTYSSYIGNDPGYDGRLQREFVGMLPRAVGNMEALVQDLESRLPVESETPRHDGRGKRPRVFIAHGGGSHNRDHLELFLWRKGYRPIIVEEMPISYMGPDSKVDYYLEKCSFAVILGDGEGVSSSDGKRYPRPNVIDELARVRNTLHDKFIVLLEKGLSLPSNEAGAVTWESFAPESVHEAFDAVERELKAHGILGVSE